MTNHKLVSTFIGNMSLNPLSTILSSNKLEGDNYVDWKRNLDIVLTVDKHKWVLTTPCPQTNDEQCVATTTS